MDQLYHAIEVVSQPTTCNDSANHSAMRRSHVAREKAFSTVSATA